MAGLYLHFPFCQRKCSYCDFYSVEKTDDIIPQFLSALHQEIELRKGTWPHPEIEIDTIYFGGGTPSLLHADQIDALIQHITSSFTLSLKSEITLEANPDTLTPDKLRNFRVAGINRISIGVQSLDDAELNLLGRIHTSEQAEELVSAAQRAGFEEVGIDLIYGLPDQSIKTWLNTIKKAVSHSPTHISAYSLTWNESTLLGRIIESGKCSRPDETAVCEMYLSTHEILNDGGYEHYEISNFAKPGHRCRHNEGYWTGELYLGLGPSSHSFIDNKRLWNIPDVREYISVLSQNKLPIAGQEILDPEQRTLERIALGLRRREGIPVRNLSGKQHLITCLHESGLAFIRNGFLALTVKGLLLADEVTLQLAF